MPRRDQVTGGTIFVLGIIVYLITTTFKMPITGAYPGPRMLPTIAAFGFVVCGLGIFLTSTFKHKEENIFMTKAGWLRIGLIIGILVLYIFSMVYLGFLIITPICTYVIVTLFAKGKESKTINRVTFSIVFTGIVYVMYVYVFGLGLPKGIIL